MGKIAIKTNATADISSILPEVFRFYDATATSTITRVSGSDNISSWGDRSVNNVPAIQTVGSEQPIYNSTTQSISFASTIRNFVINLAGFSGTIYIADAIIGVLDFEISVAINDTNITFLNNDAVVLPNNFGNVIGIVATSFSHHRSIIENYFGSKSQNLKYSNLTSMYAFFYGRSSKAFFRYVKTIPVTNTSNIITMTTLFAELNNIQKLPILNTSNVTNFDFFAAGSAPSINKATISFLPMYDTSKATYFTAMIENCFSIIYFPPINTSNGIFFNRMFAAQNAQTLSLIHLPALNYTNTNGNFDYTFFRLMKLSSLSADNVLISIAAVIAKTPGKNITNFNTTRITTATNINRRATNDIQDTISDWNTRINEYYIGNITLEGLHADLELRITEYNTKWKSWEQDLKNINELINFVRYDFTFNLASNPSGVSGQKAFYWIMAKNINVVGALAAPTTLTTEVTRSYRSNSGLTVTNSNVSAWTPVTLATNQTSNQTINNLTTQTINGITCVMFSSAKTITFNSISVTNTGNRVYIGTLYGYVIITPPTATNLRISTNSSTELPIISIMVTTTAVNETEVLLRLGFYGSFQEFNYTANTLTSANIQLTAV